MQPGSLAICWISRDKSRNESLEGGPNESERVTAGLAKLGANSNQPERPSIGLRGSDRLYQPTQLQPENITHVITPRRLLHQPLRSAHRASGKISPTTRAVGNFEPLAIASKHHCVFADYVPSPDR